MLEGQLVFACTAKIVGSDIHMTKENQKTRLRSSSNELCKTTVVLAIFLKYISIISTKKQEKVECTSFVQASVDFSI